MAEYGGGIMRLDSTGIQIVNDTGANMPLVNFLRAFSDTPSEAASVISQQAYFSGAGSASFNIRTTVPTEYVDINSIVDGTQTSVVITLNGLTSAQAFFKSTGSYSMLQLGAPMQLLLAQIAGDPASIVGSGAMWYNLSTNKLRARINAITENLATESYVGTVTAPTTADYLVGTVQAGLSAEIVVGTAPGGELGGTWATPTVDSSHAGGTHAATQAAAEATAAAANTADIATHAGAADPHTGYVKESDANWIDLTDTGATTLHSHAGGSVNTLRTTANQTINAGAEVFVDITGLTFSVVSGVDYAFDFYITFRSAATTTGWKASVNCPTGTLDFWAGSAVIANGETGVATHTERHNVIRDEMTQLTATINQAVDLNVRIRGRYLCTQNGTFAARFANELAANTDIVVQKGSWGIWF